MRFKNKMILIAVLAILWIGWIVNNACINPVQLEWEVKCKVISKGEQDRIKYSKHYSENNGTRRTFIVHSGKYGYGEIPVTVNTYMTTNIGEIVTFTFNKNEMKNDFNFDTKTSTFRETIFSIIIGAVSFCYIIFMFLFAIDEKK